MSPALMNQRILLKTRHFVMDEAIPAVELW